jgi:hypothetical protein
VTLPWAERRSSALPMWITIRARSSLSARAAVSAAVSGAS